MKIVPYEENNHEAWNRFVSTCPAGTFFHLAEWIKITETYYGFSSRSFFIKEGEEIIAVVPLFLCRSPLLGRCLIPTPVCGLLLPCTTSSEAEALIIKHMWRLLDDTDAKFLELRYDEQHVIDGLPANRENVLQRLSLLPGEEALWKKMTSPGRRCIKKAKKWDLQSKSGIHYLPQFYRLYAGNMRDFGYPLFSRRFFDLLSQEFAELIELSVVTLNNKVLGALLSFRFRETVTALWIGSRKEFWHMRINNFIYWESIKKGCREGYTMFDIGRTRENSGIARFKAQLGAISIPLCYQYLSRGKFNAPSVQESQNRYKLPMAVWKHLPIWLTKVIGPPLGKWIPL